MNYLYTLTKIIKCRQRKKNVIKHGSFILGFAIGGTFMLLLNECLCKGIGTDTNIDLKDINDDADIKRDEIKESIEKITEESLGDVGVAMEKALNDLDEKQNKNV